MVTESDVSNHIFIYLSQRLARRQFPDGEARSDSFREENLGQFLPLAPLFRVLRRARNREIRGGRSYFTVARKHRCRAVGFRTGARGFRSFENLRANDDSTLSVRPIIFRFPHASYSTCMCIN